MQSMDNPFRIRFSRGGYDSSYLLIVFVVSHQFAVKSRDQLTDTLIALYDLLGYVLMKIDGKTTIASQ